MLWGENGSGKSSLIDALEFLFTGQISHLIGTQGISLERHAHHQAFSLSDLTVDGTFDPGAISVTRTTSSLTPIPAALSPTWETIRKGRWILRRYQLLEFIHADPAERFRTIGSMIGIEALDQIELAMMRARDQLDGEVSARRQDIQRIKANLGRIVGRPPSEPNDVLDLINDAARKLGLTEVHSLGAVGETHQTWLRSIRRADERAVHQLNAVVAACEACSLPSGLEEQSVELRSQYLRLASQRESLARVSEVSLLREGRRILELRTTETCPLCDQPIDSRVTLERIVERQKLLQDLSDEFAEFRTACGRTSEAYTSASRRIVDLVQEVRASPAAAEEAAARLEPIADEFQRFAETAGGLASFESAWDAILPTSHFAALENSLASIRQAAGFALSAQTETEHERAVLDLITQAIELDTGARSHSEQSENLSRLVQLHQRASCVYDSFSDTKKAEIRRVYSTIEGDIGRLYQQLHPGEPFANIQLLLQEGRRASTQLRVSSFGGDPLDPRALSSEGHLDSLGPCIFLAFVRHFLTRCPLLVLDDIVMSVDASHRGRIAKLLIQEFSDRQLIVTTHDEIWFEMFIDHERAYRAEGRFLNQRIQSWSFDDGARFQGHRPQWDVIEGKLSDGDKRAANDGRQYGEWILKEIVRRVRAQVELKDRYTFADLFEPARRRLRELLPSKTGEIDTLFAEVMAAGLPATFLSHDNDLAPSVSIQEVRRYCDAVHSLHEWFSCPSCHRLLNYFRDLCELRCDSPKCPEQRVWRTK